MKLDRLKSRVEKIYDKDIFIIILLFWDLSFIWDKVIQDSKLTFKNTLKSLVIYSTAYFVTAYLNKHPISKFTNKILHVVLLILAIVLPLI